MVFERSHDRAIFYREVADKVLKSECHFRRGRGCCGKGMFARMAPGVAPTGRHGVYRGLQCWVMLLRQATYLLAAKAIGCPSWERDKLADCEAGLLT